MCVCICIYIYLCMYIYPRISHVLQVLLFVGHFMCCSMLHVLGVAVCSSVGQCVAIRCSILQCLIVNIARVAVCCSMLQCVAVEIIQAQGEYINPLRGHYSVACCSVLQCSTVGCSWLKWVAVGCNEMQRAAAGCSGLCGLHLVAASDCGRCPGQRSGCVHCCEASHGHNMSTATHCERLQHTTVQKNTPQHTASTRALLRGLARSLNVQQAATHCNTLQHTATHCNTVQHTATHCIRSCTAARPHTVKKCPLQHAATH